jgi:hypothetical protein
MFAMLASIAAAAQSSGGGLLLERFNNTQALGTPDFTTTTEGAALLLEHLNGPLSLRLQGTWTPGATGEYALHCGCAESDHLYLWVDDHMMCDTQSWTGWQGPSRGPAAVPLVAGKPVYLRAHLHRALSRPLIPVAINLTLNVSGRALLPIPPAELQPVVPPLQARRMQHQRGLLTGWNSWWSTIGAKPGYRGGMLAVALLPESFALTMVLCQLSTASCLSESTVAGTLTGPRRVRPGIKALDGSYAELWAPAPGGLNVSLQWSASRSSRSGSSSSTPVGAAEETAGDSLTVLISPLPNSTQAGLNLSDWAVAVTGRFICWNGEQGLCSAGDVAVDGTSTLTGRAAGLRVVTVVGSQGNLSKKMLNGLGLNVSMDEQVHPALLFSLAQPVVVCAAAGSGSPPCVAVDVTAQLHAKREAELATYTARGGAELAQSMEAMQSVLMWNILWNPSEAGPWANVDRGWGQPYCMFDWDNLFASYMLSLDSSGLAVSNLIQIIKSRVMAGFVPGYTKGIEKTRDKTEPPIGSKVVLEIYKRYKDEVKWVVELLFDDLYGWHEWFVRRRVLEPLGLICLGSDPINTTNGAGDSRVDPNDWNVNQMQGARYESGQDNSPLYDEGDLPLFNNVTHHMEIYDVGFSAMFTMEARALAELAAVIPNRGAERATLLKRASAMEELMNEHLWDESRGVFANRFLKNDTFSGKIGPTSFFPMQSGAATVGQAEAMVTGWLSNRSRFCVSPDWPFAGQEKVKVGKNGTDISCFSGLPSISADDPSYCDGNNGHCGYWRGHTVRVAVISTHFHSSHFRCHTCNQSPPTKRTVAHTQWGPLSMLTYWGLSDQKYRNSTVVATARKALVKQMREMLGAVWRESHHVCENYSPWKQPLPVRVAAAEIHEHCCGGVLCVTDVVAHGCRNVQAIRSTTGELPAPKPLHHSSAIILCPLRLTLLVFVWVKRGGLNAYMSVLEIELDKQETLTMVD